MLNKRKLKFTAIDAFKPKWRIGVIRIRIIGIRIIVAIIGLIGIIIVIGWSFCSPYIRSLISAVIITRFLIASKYSKCNSISDRFQQRKRVISFFFNTANGSSGFFLTTANGSDPFVFSDSLFITCSACLKLFSTGSSGDTELLITVSCILALGS